MWRVGLKSLVAKKFRLVSTTLAVLLGVAFLAGSLVFVDTIGKTFDDLFVEVGKGVDVHVRSSESIEVQFGEVRGSIDQSLVDDIAAIPGVKAVQPATEGYAQMVDRDGEPIGNPSQGPPTLGLTWQTVPELASMRLVGDASRPPGPGEMVIDRGTANKAGFGVGDTVTVLLEGPPTEFVVSGIATFGDADSALGATMALFDLETAQRVLGEPGKLDFIDVVADEGADTDALLQSIDAAMPNGVEAITGAQLIDENQDAVADALSFFNTFMLVFSGVALFVGAFIIYNTFSIIVAQRAREMALLRALGATSRQILASVQVEAFVVGLVASIIGIVAGVAVASGLKQLMAALGIDIPTGSVVFAPRTVVVSLVVGMTVTLVSSIAPALRAARTPPMAAIRETAVDHSSRSVVRLAVGAVVLAAGVLAILAGLFADIPNALATVGLGAVATFLGVAILGPVLARPVSAVLGAPLTKLRGFSGRLASENAQRNPKRTSATASALMIGVALVGFITIFAASARASINETIDEAFLGDIIIDSGAFGFGGLSPELAAELNEVPAVESASGVRLGFAEFEGSTDVVYGVDPDQMGDIVDVGVIAGRIEDLGEGELAVFQDKAEDEGWELGDRVTVRFADSGSRSLKIAVIYGESDLAGNYFIGNAAYEANFDDVLDFQVYVITDPSIPADDARIAVENVAAGYANATVLDLTEYKEEQSAGINQLLGLVYALLGLSVLIALIGIANTLALSVVERTHELGLLRAVGLTRRQLRSSVRWESVIIALFGAVLGLAVGVFFGWSVVRALEEDGFNSLVIPPGQLLIVAIIAAVVGVLAAIGPARRAAKLDVLDAIAAE